MLVLRCDFDKKEEANNIKRKEKPTERVHEKIEGPILRDLCKYKKKERKEKKNGKKRKEKHAER